MTLDRFQTKNKHQYLAQCVANYSYLNTCEGLFCGFLGSQKKTYSFPKEALASSGLHRLKKNDPLYQVVVGEAKIKREILSDHFTES